MAKIDDEKEDLGEQHQASYHSMEFEVQTEGRGSRFRRERLGRREVDETALSRRRAEAERKDKRRERKAKARAVSLQRRTGRLPEDADPPLDDVLDAVRNHVIYGADLSDFAVVLDVQFIEEVRDARRVLRPFRPVLAPLGARTEARRLLRAYDRLQRRSDPKVLARLWRA